MPEREQQLNLNTSIFNDKNSICCTVLTMIYHNITGSEKTNNIYSRKHVRKLLPIETVNIIACNQLIRVLVIYNES